MKTIIFIPIFLGICFLIPPVNGNYITCNKIKQDTVFVDVLRHDTLKYDTLKYDTLKYDSIQNALYNKKRKVLQTQQSLQYIDNQLDIMGTLLKNQKVKIDSIKKKGIKK